MMFEAKNVPPVGPFKVTTDRCKAHQSPILLPLLNLQFLEPSRLNGLGEILDLIQDRMGGTFKDLPDFLNVIQTGQPAIDPESRESQSNAA
jgi:hypothetical protein